MLLLVGHAPPGTRPMGRLTPKLTWRNVLHRASLGRALAGIRRHRMFCAHITPILEPLLFAPAFIAVGWALVKARRSDPPSQKEHP